MTKRTLDLQLLSLDFVCRTSDFHFLLSVEGLCCKTIPGRDLC